MNRFLTQTSRALPTVFVLAAAFALPIAAHADDASKKQLAIQLVKLQQKNGELVEQITNMAVQPELDKWMPQLQQRVPNDKKKDVSDKLNAELNKFAGNTRKVVQAQADKTAQDVLVPIFLDKLSESELKTIVTYLQTPASAKFAALGGDAASAWENKIVEGTRTSVLDYMKNFDTKAEQIISAAAANPSTPASAVSGAGKANP
jgi:hypothetical protein